mmetsp:Transcript_25241/g.69708  ORF Transcript_25241/g.69708 Transcript_25241/m.69708 type:complete len:158 (-) Transcript_25241:67-540(-)
MFRKVFLLLLALGSSNAGQYGKKGKGCMKLYECAGGNCPATDGAGNEYYYPTFEELGSGRFVILTPLFDNAELKGEPLGRFRADVKFYPDADNSGTAVGALELYDEENIGVYVVFHNDESNNYGYSIGGESKKLYTSITPRRLSLDPKFIVEYTICK